MIHYYGLPALRTPWTEALGSAYTYQDHPICRDFELRLVDCVEAYGWYRSQEKCNLLFKDLEECLYNLKRNKRLFLMKQERSRLESKGRKREDLPVPFIDLY